MKKLFSIIFASIALTSCVDTVILPDNKTVDDDFWQKKTEVDAIVAAAYAQLRDTTAGFVCWTRKVLQTIDLDNIHFKGYAFQIEMKYTALRLGFKIKEVPVVFVNRELGTSKMSGGIFSEAFFGVIRLRFMKFKSK